MEALTLHAFKTKTHYCYTCSTHVL